MTTDMTKAPDGAAILGLHPETEAGGQFALRIDPETTRSLETLPEGQIVFARLVAAVEAEDDDRSSFPHLGRVAPVTRAVLSTLRHPVELSVVLARRQHRDAPVEVGEPAEIYELWHQLVENVIRFPPRP